MGHTLGLTFLERRDVVPPWGSSGETCSVHLPSPDPFPDKLQCLNVSIVPSATCQTVFPGRITDNMVCAGGIAGQDACQVNGRRPCMLAKDRK